MSKAKQWVKMALLGFMLAGMLTGCNRRKEPAAPKMVEAKKVEIPAPAPMKSQDVFAMLRLRDPNKFIDRLATWVKIFQPTMDAEMLRSQAAGMGVDLKELRAGENAAMFVLTPSGPTPQPAMVGLLPVASASPMIQSLKSMLQGNTITSSGTYTMIVKGDDPQGAAQAEKLGATLIDVDKAPAATDVQLFINMEALMAKYGEMLNSQLPMIQPLLSMAMASQPGGAAKAAQVQQMIPAILKAVMDFSNQAQYLNFGVDMAPTRLELSMIAKGKPARGWKRCSSMRRRARRS